MIPHRLRSGIFRAIESRVKAKRFLDLSGGCGIVGIEALSRGACLSTIVERSARLRSVISKNLDACEVKEGHAEVSDLEALPFVQRMAKKKRRWDVVFLDAEIEATAQEILRSLGRSRLIAEGGALVVRHPESAELPEMSGGLSRWRLYKQEGEAVSYYEKLRR